MARVLYGVMGNTMGHVARALAIASLLPAHEFHFVGGGRVPEVLRDRYPVLEVPVARTVYKRQRAAVLGTCRHLAGCVAAAPRVRREIRALIEHWQPTVAICDREFFLPPVARAAGLPCFAVDHSHVLQVCRYPVPAAQFPAWALGRLEDALFFNRTSHNLVVTFYQPPLKPGGQNELLPPVLRQAAREIQPRPGDHVFAYQSTPAFPPLLTALRQLARPVIIYGAGTAPGTTGNLTFKPFDPRAILADLASCAYTVTTAGHNLICEALHFGKPLLCLPVAMNFEQFLNAWHVRALGYGDFCANSRPTLATFTRFEARLPEFRAAIAKQFVDGTDQVIRRVNELIAQPPA